MRVSRLFTVKSLIVLLSVAVLALLAAAQQTPVQQNYNYQAGRPPFPNLLAPYRPAHVAAPNFANSARIDTLMRNGQLMLSLDDAIAMALENNLDIAIARYNLPISDTDVLRAKSGQQILGVNTGLVQGTPGGGTGSTTVGGLGTSTTGATGTGTGGTSTAAGGAGSGSAGLVLSTEGSGPPLGSYDPVVTAGLSLEHLTTPTASPFQGALALKQNTSTANISYNQYFASGTNLNVGFNNQRQTTNSTFSELSPVLNTGFRATLTQHLLQGLSFNANRRLIRIAKNNREISDVAFRNQVIQTVSQIENIYWDLVSAYENVRVQESSLALAQKTLADNKKQVEIGTLAPIEIVRAESGVATANQSLITAQTNLQLQELLMKNAVTKNLSDPVLVTAHVVPTDTMTLPASEPVVPIQDLINDALAHRPELAQSRIDLTNREITRKSTANLLLPSVDLVGWYGGAALAGNTNLLAICAPGQSSNRFCIPASDVRPPSGLSDAFSTMFGYNNPDYGVGFNINIPIRNRSSQATQVRSELEYRQSQMLLQQLQNQIAIQVRNAQFTVQQNRAQVLAAQSAEELARQSLDAEQKKYALGASTTTLVLTAQRDLAQAQSNTVAALDNYEKSRVQLDLATGLTLTHNGITMADAENGKVETMPHVPGIVPRQPSQELQMEQEPQQGVPQPPAGTQPQGATEPQAEPQTAAPGTVAPSGAQPAQPATPQPQANPQPQQQPQPQPQK
ncbi:MAG TPA: TolC family protein [Terriglobales bacterium]|nr:TolC family protein [Terriglobales bacterium]